MLVLSRKANEMIVVNGNITVRVLEIKHGRVRIGIEAPKEIPIERVESSFWAECSSNDHMGVLSAAH